LDQQALAEYRYRAVREVLGGSPIGEVGERFGTSRQPLHAWRRRFEAEGVPGLVDRSRRPKSSPSRLDAEVEALICQLRREHPRWGARRVAFELGQRGLASVPGRATVYRVMARNGLVKPQEHGTSGSTGVLARTVVTDTRNASPAKAASTFEVWADPSRRSVTRMTWCWSDSHRRASSAS
jgi:transposase